MKMYTVILLCFVSVSFVNSEKHNCGKHSVWDKWYDGCNWCVCTDHGQTCTDNSCYRMAVDVCEPYGQKWRDGVYRCQCVENGIECIADHRAVHAMRHEPFTCEERPGCVCGLDGVLTCVAERQADGLVVHYKGLGDNKFVSNVPPLTDTYITYNEKMTCKDVKRWYSGSKRCFCGDNSWEPICGEPRHIAHRVDGFRLKITQCYTNQAWEYNCRKCKCHMYGLGFCVRIPNCKRSIDRNILVNNDCLAGEQWKEGCKYCKCTPGQKVVCEETGCNYSGNIAQTKVKVKFPNIVLGETDVRIIGAGKSKDDDKKLAELPDSEGPVLKDLPRFQIPPAHIFDMDRSFRNNKNEVESVKIIMCDDKYKPGQIFYDKCNLCRCTHTGDSKCTAILCP